jgi:hypothetical protein
MDDHLKALVAHGYDRIAPRYLELAQQSLAVHPAFGSHALPAQTAGAPSCPSPDPRIGVYGASLRSCRPCPLRESCQ